MSRLVVACLLMFSLSMPAFAEPTASHIQAAEALLAATNMEKVLTDATNVTLTAQISANPTLVPFEGTMREFLGKYMGYQALKPDLVKLYADAFTESELKELTAFYNTPTGKKAINSMGDLMAKGAALGQQKVMEHQDELIQMIQKRAAELQQ